MTIDSFTLGELMIGKRKYEVKDCELRQSELLFYVDNPRVYSALRTIDSEAPTQKEIEEHMCQMEHVKQLRLSIAENGGLIDPLIVRDGDFVVLEGNSRLAAYRILCKNDPVKWGLVKCKVLPADIDDAAIFTLLGQYHIVGRKDWSPYEQAGYLYRRKKETKIPDMDIAKELGITKSQATNYIKVFEYMKAKNDLTPERWSYYEELLKNRKIQNAIKEKPQLEEKIVSQIQSEEIVNAADIRKIGEITANTTKSGKKIREKYIDGEMDMYEAFAALQDSGALDKVYKDITHFRDVVTDPSFKESILASPKKSDILFCIKKINQSLKSIQNELMNG